MATAIEIYYLVIQAAVFASSWVWVVILIRNFIRKKTIGTGYLWLTYLSLALGETFFMLSMLFQSLGGSDALIISSYVQTVLYLVCNATATVYMYFFMNRHIMNDNDLLKSVVGTAVGITAGIIFGLTLTEVANGFGLDPTQTAGKFAFLVHFEGSNISFVAPKWIYLMFYFVPAIIFFYSRMAYQTFQLRRKAKDELARKGLRYILIALVSYFLILPLFGVYLILYDFRSVALLSTLLTLKVILTGNAFVFAYLGFIMPNWLKARIRGKSYFEKVYTSKLKPVLDSYSFSQGGIDSPKRTKEIEVFSNDTQIEDKTTQKIVEITEA